MFDNSQKSPANRLQRGLVNLAASTQVATKELFGKPSPNDRASTLIAAVLDQLVIRLKPQGPGPTTDRNFKERIANVITSLPYGLVGVHALRKRQTAAGKLWGASLIGVSAGAAAFHLSDGPRYRPICRKIDYWMIAISSTALMRAVFPETPASTALLSLLAVPFQPFHVSSANIAALEVEYIRSRTKREDLRPVQKAHLTAAVLGAGCFFLEDNLPQVPLLHAAWHCLSAYATASTNHLLALKEFSENDL